MDHLKDLRGLRNRYYVLRHGESEANASGLISSSPDRALTAHGLTQKGRQQVAASVEDAIAKGWLGRGTLIYSSDFKRALETAEIARKLLRADKVRTDPALRERSFGNLEGKDHKSNYLKVWARDKHDLDQTEHGVESVTSVVDRVTGFVRALEDSYDGEVILLVSHGDPLFALLATAAGIKPTRHRFYKRLKTAEIRPLTFAQSH